MPDLYQNTDYLVAFLKGELPVKEHALVEAAIRTDPVLETIKVYRLGESRFTKTAEWSLEHGDTLSSPLLPGFTCPLAGVFPDRGRG